MNAFWLIPATMAGFAAGGAFMCEFAHSYFRRKLRERNPKHLPFVDLPGGYWKPEDAASWLSFRGSPAGRKMGVLLNNTVTRSAVVATADTDNPAHSCGRACGVRDTISLLDSMLPPPAQPDHNSPAGAPSSNLEGPSHQDADDAFAHLAP